MNKIEAGCARAAGNNRFLLLDFQPSLSEEGGDAFLYPSFFLLSIAARILSGVMGKSVMVTPMASAMAEA
jgi:hypothetical protein